MDGASSERPPTPKERPRRRGRLRIAAVTALALILLGAGFTVRTLWRAGAFRTLTPHFAGSCRLVPGPVGPEDITIDAARRVAYVSASDRRALAAGRPVPGAIFAYSLDAPDAAPVNLTPDADISFQPHGISLWVGDGRRVLFAISHPPPGTAPHAHTVEVFDVEGGALVHRASLTDPLLVMPNDLVAVGLDRFYLTNTHAHPPGLLQTAETYLELSGANVLRYGPGGFREAVGGLVFPNGINVSPDGRTLYVASLTPQTLLVYDRDPATDRLSLRREIPLGSGPDNIEVDERGDLWIAAHPKLLAVVAHAKDPAAAAPAQVLRVRVHPSDGRKAVQEVYLDLGEQIAAASVAARLGPRLLIGQIFDEGFLDCRLDG